MPPPLLPEHSDQAMLAGPCWLPRLLSLCVSCIRLPLGKKCSTKNRSWARAPTTVRHHLCSNVKASRKPEQAKTCFDYSSASVSVSLGWRFLLCNQGLSSTCLGRNGSKTRPSSSNCANEQKDMGSSRHSDIKVSNPHTPLARSMLKMEPCRG